MNPIIVELNEIDEEIDQFIQDCILFISQLSTPDLDELDITEATSVDPSIVNPSDESSEDNEELDPSAQATLQTPATEQSGPISTDTPDTVRAIENNSSPVESGDNISKESEKLNQPTQNNSQIPVAGSSRPTNHNNSRPSMAYATKVKPTTVVISDNSSADDEASDESEEEYRQSPLSPVATPIPRPRVFSQKKQKEIDRMIKFLNNNSKYNTEFIILVDYFCQTLDRVGKKIQLLDLSSLNWTNPANEGEFSYHGLGTSYFREEYNVPDNEDIGQPEIDFTLDWTENDKIELVNLLLKLSRKKIRQRLKYSIADLHKRDLHEEIIFIESFILAGEIRELNKTSLGDIALPLEMEYDWEYVAKSLNWKHTPQEYKSFWKQILHPSIKNNQWSEFEHEELANIAASCNNMQNWDAIAEQLDTGRTGYQCFVYYSTNIDNSSKRKWTSSEIEYLKGVIDDSSTGDYIPWGIVAATMDDKTKKRLSIKYRKMTRRRKYRFKVDDIVLLKCYDIYGLHFQKISQIIPGKSKVKVRTRFVCMTKIRRSRTWLLEDDEKLLNIMANLKSRSFSDATIYFPGKYSRQLRFRYNTLVKWMKAHPGLSIAKAPRRKPRDEYYRRANLSLKNALRCWLEMLNKKIMKNCAEQDVEQEASDI